MENRGGQREGGWESRARVIAELVLFNSVYL